MSNDQILNLEDFDLVAPQNDAKPMELTHPHEGTPLLSNGKPMVIHLLGAKSKEFRAAINNQARVEQAKRVKPTPSIEAEEARSAKLLAAATVGWDNLYFGVDANGKPQKLEFTRANAERLYRERDWIRIQVDAFVADEKNFWNEPEKK